MKIFKIPDNFPLLILGSPVNEKRNFIGNFLQSSRPKATDEFEDLKGNVKFRFAIRANPISPENF